MGEQHLEQAGGRALADGHASSNANHIGDLRRGRAEKGRGNSIQLLNGRDVELEQAREREIDMFHLLQRDRVVQAAQSL